MQLSRVGLLILPTAGIDANPKRKRGNALQSSLALRVRVECVILGRVKYSLRPPFSQNTLRRLLQLLNLFRRRGLPIEQFRQSAGVDAQLQAALLQSLQ